MDLSLDGSQGRSLGHSPDPDPSPDWIQVKVKDRIQIPGLGQGQSNVKVKTMTSKSGSKSGLDPDTTLDPWRFLCNSRASFLFLGSFVPSPHQ